MQLVGHKTENIYRRYAIVAEADLRDGVKKLATLHGTRSTGGTPRFGHNLGTIGEGEAAERRPTDPR